jgi:hypothetical protein
MSQLAQKRKLQTYSMKRLLSLQKTVEWQSLINYGTWNLLSQDVPAPDLRDEGTPRHATSGTRIEFIWLHQNMGAKRPIFFIEERLRWARSAAILK